MSHIPMNQKSRKNNVGRAQKSRQHIFGRIKHVSIVYSDRQCLVSPFQFWVPLWLGIEAFSASEWGCR